MSDLYSAVTPYLADGTPSIFESPYKNLRFNVRIQEYVAVNSDWEANLPGLSFVKYGTTDYWRAILIANGLDDPINDVVAGMTLAIPYLADIQAYLSNNAADTSTVTL